MSHYLPYNLKFCELCHFFFFLNRFRVVKPYFLQYGHLERRFKAYSILNLSLEVTIKSNKTLI